MAKLGLRVGGAKYMEPNVRFFRFSFHKIIKVLSFTTKPSVPSVLLLLLEFSFFIVLTIHAFKEIRSVGLHLL